MPNPRRFGAWRRSVVVAIAMAIGLGTFASAPAMAADASDFDPGYLISDEDFFDSDALSAASTMSFIYGMNKGCLTGRICIENYRESIKAKAANTRCKAIAAKPNLNAGQIISTVALACGISPKAILVILQKEQSLITAQAPSERAFQASMGAGCPDTAPCDGKYAGFYENVYYGAYLLKGYTLPTSSLYTRYQAGKVSSIAYSPRSYGSKPTCGFKSVYVKNQATHALYVYTPYTPNKAALTNLYGTGDSCSAYGNRNFWRLWTDWFGATGSEGALAIDAMYTKLGGSSGSLGSRVGEVIKSTATTSGLYQEYTNGIIAWSRANGAHLIKPELKVTWKNRVADLGWPKQDTVTSTAAGGGTYQNFDLGLLTRSTGGTTYTMWGATRTLYLDAKGPAGPMGWATGFQAADANGRWTQKFTTGTAYREEDKTGFLGAALVAEYERRGGVTSSLGWPKAFPTTSTASGGGTLQYLDKGMLVSSGLGTFAVFGATAAKFDALGGPAAVGWPKANRAYVGDTTWLGQDFEKGSIVVKGSTSAYMATVFVPAWVKSGATTGTIGAPTTNPIVTGASGGGVYQGFKNVALANKTGGKVYRLAGQMRIAWRANSYAAGVLGWPTSTPAKDAALGLTVQKFETGLVIANSTKYGVVGSHQWTLAKSMGVGNGALGWPTSTIKKSTAGAGGDYQAYTAGTITWQESRDAIFVPKVLWTALAANGGVAGSLGWPIGPAKGDGKTTTTTQKFEGGSITWTKAKGAVVTLTAK